MALQKTLTLDNGLVATDAYHRIMDATVRAIGPNVGAEANIATYLDRDRALANGPPIVVRRYSIPFDKDDDTQSAHAQIYTYLKTLDDFTGSTDV